MILPIQGERLSLTGRSTSLDDTVAAYEKSLNSAEWQGEILLVPDGRNAVAACRRLESALDCVRACPAVSGWGGAVCAGLRASRGDLLCYTNYERTSSAALDEMLAFARRNPSLVLRANRRTRASVIQRIGSLLFNLECRALLGIAAWDVNGTPKVFPRSFSHLLDLTRQDDLIDAEFSAVCERWGYPVVEIPIDARLSRDLDSRPDYYAALRMYLGVPGVRRQVRRAA